MSDWRTNFLQDRCHWTWQISKNWLHFLCPVIDLVVSAIHALPNINTIRPETWSYLCNKGELQLPVVRWWLGCSSSSFDMQGNQGFTLPPNLGDLGAEVTALDLSQCCLMGTWAVLMASHYNQLIVRIMIWIRFHSREYWRTYELDFDWSHRPSSRRYVSALCSNAWTLPPWWAKKYWSR